MIFAREISGGLTSLVKKLDVATGKNSEAKMGSFVCFLSDDEALEKSLKKLVEKEKVKNLIFVMDKPDPPGYEIAKDAEVTVVLYTNHEVKASYTFKKGALTDKDIDKIVGDLPKILPKR